MDENKNNQAQDSEFSDTVRAQLLEIAKEREHRAWLIGAIKRLALYASAVILAFGVVWDALTKALRFIGEHLK